MNDKKRRNKLTLSERMRVCGDHDISLKQEEKCDHPRRPF